jgi:hypothetical protein
MLVECLFIFNWNCIHYRFLSVPKDKNLKEWCQHVALYFEIKWTFFLVFVCGNQPRSLSTCFRYIRYKDLSQTRHQLLLLRKRFVWTSLSNTQKTKGEREITGWMIVWELNQEKPDRTGWRSSWLQKAGLAADWTVCSLASACGNLSNTERCISLPCSKHASSAIKAQPVSAVMEVISVNKLHGWRYAQLTKWKHRSLWYRTVVTTLCVCVSI